MRTLVAVLTFLTLMSAECGIGHAQAVSRDAVEAVVMRSFLERGAARACAAHENDTETETLLVRTWRLDVAELWEDLRKIGYPEDEVRKLADRLDLNTATPKFVDREALGAFCAAISDWRRRFELFLNTVPQLEVRKLLRR